MSETMQEGGDINAAEAPEVNEAPKGKEKVEKKPRQTFKEKFADSTNEKERVELAEKVAELRLDTEARQGTCMESNFVNMKMSVFPVMNFTKLSGCLTITAMLC